MASGYAAGAIREQTTSLVEIRPLLRNVYLWMCLGLVVTAVSAYFTITSRALLNLLMSPFWTWGIFFLQLMLVATLAGAIFRLSVPAAGVIFIAYSALTGFSLSLLVLHYGLGTLVPAFVTTAALFGTMTIAATVTRVDLTRTGTYAFMALIGLLIAMIVNIFIQSAEFDLVISVVGVIIFTALTAADTQKIQQWAADPTVAARGNDVMARLSILGALTLYLDFLNLFIFLVRIFGRNR
ncbi:MAG: Bax inhibitor-1/YccA family protein [Chloroflexi bacterium]|nr:Bax inhibitor-1/YccA family protein [Chloroflexota bacterium]MBV9601532.1 Bax inhibitor-1/YccA family protein [Chloroflexota bacterium]